MHRRDFLLAAAMAAVSPTRALAAAAARAPFVLATADLEARVLVIDPESGAIRKAILTPAKPRSIESAGKTAVVAHSELGAISLIDTSALAVVGLIRGLDEPRYTAAHPDDRHAYVSDAGRGEVLAIDLQVRRVVGRVSVGPRARHVTIEPTGNTLWVALGSKAEYVAVVDVERPSRPRLVDRFRPPFLAHDVSFAPDGRHVWVSSGDRQELAVFDPAGRLLARPSGDWPPQHVSFARGTAYVTSGWSGTLRLHRLDGAPLAAVPVPVGSYNVQHGHGLVVTPSLGHGVVTILDEQGRLLRRERVARSSHDACLA